MIDVLNDLKVDIDEDATFQEFMSQFSKDFDQFASAYALKALGVDLECFDIRYYGVVDSEVVQEIIDKTTYRKLDEDVFKLFEFLDAGDVQKAYLMFEHIFANQKIDQPNLTERELEEYLIEVITSKRFEDSDNWVWVITNFKKLAGKQQLKEKLEIKLPVTSKVKAPKI